MSFLTYARDERMVVVGLTAAFVGVVATMRVLLQQWRDGTEIKPQQPTTQYITQETEDSLKPSTLDMLLGHYNFAIREVAAKIVCDRAVNDGETIDYLLWGITRPDYDERMKNLRTLAFITDPRMNLPTLTLLQQTWPTLVKTNPIYRKLIQAQYWARLLRVRPLSRTLPRRPRAPGEARRQVV